MEVPDATLSTVDTAHYDETSAAAVQSTLQVLKTELESRSFDLGDDDVDDDVDLNTAFLPPPAPVTVASTSQLPMIDEHDTDEGSDLLEEADEDDDLHPPEGMDVFPEETADEMIEELKEIGMFKWIAKYVAEEQVALEKLLFVFGIVVPTALTEEERPSPIYLLRILKIAISRTLRNRFPLEQYTSPSDFLSLLRSSTNIVVLTGAGISTNCGIPDFRSPSGIYARLVASGRWPELSDPQEMFDMSIFLENPEIFYSFAKELYPTSEVQSGGHAEQKEGGEAVNTVLAGGKKAGKVHHWIRSLEKQDKLLRNYTQNIDTLEMIAGIEKVLHAHGSFATCSCVMCKTQFPGDTIKDAIFAETVPLCPVCTAATASATADSEPASKKRRLVNGHTASIADDDDDEEDYVPPWKNKPILKPDITFFGQALDDAFDRCLLLDREKVDLLIVVGTSLQVAPVSELLGHIPHRVPQVLINRDPVPHVVQHVDIALLGDCDKIVEWIEENMAEDTKGSISGKEPSLAFPDGMDNVWLFEGANEEHRWMQRMRELLAEDDADHAAEGLSDGKADAGSVPATAQTAIAEPAATKSTAQPSAEAKLDTEDSLATTVLSEISVPKKEIQVAAWTVNGSPKGVP